MRSRDFQRSAFLRQRLPAISNQNPTSYSIPLHQMTGELRTKIVTISGCMMILIVRQVARAMRGKTRSHFSFKYRSLRRWLTGWCTEQMAITMVRHPFGAREVTIVGAARAIRLGARIDAKHQLRDFTPIRVVGFGVEQTQISNEVLMVVGRQRGLVWRHVCDIRIERRGRHETPSSLEASS